MEQSLPCPTKPAGMIRLGPPVAVHELACSPTLCIAPGLPASLRWFLISEAVPEAAAQSWWPPYLQTLPYCSKKKIIMNLKCLSSFCNLLGIKIHNQMHLFFLCSFTAREGLFDVAKYALDSSHCRVTQSTPSQGSDIAHFDEKKCRMSGLRAPSSCCYCLTEGLPTQPNLSTWKGNHFQENCFQNYLFLKCSTLPIPSFSPQ